MEEDKLLKNKKSRKIIKLKISLPKSNNKNEQAIYINKPVKFTKPKSNHYEQNMKKDQIFSYDRDGFINIYWKVFTRQIPNTMDKFYLNKEIKLSNLILAFILENKTEKNNIKFTFIIEHKQLHNNKFDIFYHINTNAEVKYDIGHSAKLGSFSIQYLNEVNILQEDFTNDFSKHLLQDNVILFQINIFTQFTLRLDKNLPFPGIKNEGNTCFINSLLQSWNIINPLKKAILSIQTKEKIESPITLSFQRIFYYLIKESKSISALNLIRTNFLKNELGKQQDIEEFYLRFLKVIKKIIKGTEFFDIINLFEGKYVNIIEYLNEKKVITEEKFYDLPLTTIVNYILN